MREARLALSSRAAPIASVKRFTKEVLMDETEAYAAATAAEKAWKESTSEFGTKAYEDLKWAMYRAWSAFRHVKKYGIP